ncbi:MAG: hypothetical protein ACE5WD_08190 [Candidatus Aminicenantia bacterium]
MKSFKIKRIHFAFFLILFFVLSILLQIKIEKNPRRKIPGSSIIYLPSGRYLKFITFGYNSFLADIIYLWAIQYYSDYSIADRFNYLEHIFSIISELDPRYLDPYRIGALIAWYEAKQIDLALKLLDIGIKKNPDQWILPLEAGHYAQIFKKDYKLARYYFGLTKKIEGAPPIAERLYANAAFKAMDLKTAYQSWLEIYQTTQNERIKKIAFNHLYQTKATIDILLIKKAITQYERIYNRKPMNLDQLKKAGILNQIPKDLDGKDYLYDFKTGEVKPPTLPWKR